MFRNYFVSGIGTDVGKTVASAILCKALNAAYWKPIQSGTLVGSDKDMIRKLCGEEQLIIDECYSLKEPLSPHTAARKEGITIDAKRLVIPKHHGNLIIEGAGGLMVPITRELLYHEWVKANNLPVILVSRHYLGSINHTMLSLHLLKTMGAEIVGVIFVGKDNDNNETLICERYQVRSLGNIPEVSTVNSTFVQIYADELINNWSKLNFKDLV
jgi:dethiobiotin synthetase